MQVFKRFTRKRVILATALCGIFVLLTIVGRNAITFHKLDKENVLVLFRSDLTGLFPVGFPQKAIKRLYDRPVLVQVPSNFDKWNLLPKVTSAMSAKVGDNVFCASCSRIDDANFLELINANALMQVRELELINCSKLSDKSIAQISKLSKLQNLNLSSTNCSDEGCKQLSSLQELNALYIVKTRVSGECFVGGWNSLENLDMDCCPMSRTLFKRLAKLPRLQSLSVSYYDGIVEDLEELLQRPNIISIRINAGELSEEETTRLTTQYTDNQKIEFRRVEYNFDERQRIEDEMASEPWLEPGMRIDSVKLGN